MIALIGAAAGLASCKDGKPKGAEDPGAAIARAETPVEPVAPIPAETPAPKVLAESAADAPVVGAPAFAVVYPGGRLDPSADEALGETALAFTTEASPEEIVEFYRRKAETAGLVSVMSMNQGDVRGYGASDAAGATSLRVLAHPSDAGRTAVQLSWSGGK